MAVITFLSDFGTQDGYAAAMKGVALREHPQAQLCDVTHDVAPQDVLGGAFALAQAAPWFPSGSYHVAVVDPGVGTERRALVIEAEGHTFIGPDNGLFALVAPSPPARAYSIARPPSDWSLQPTFHGRDLFARAAGWLASGHTIEELGGLRVEPVGLSLPLVHRDDGSHFRGEVIHVDRFGNLITNLPSELVRGRGFTVELCGTLAPGGRTYADVAPGRLVAYPGSAGYVEVAVSGGSAAQTLAARRTQWVRLATRAPGAL